MERLLNSSLIFRSIQTFTLVPVHFLIGNQPVVKVSASLATSPIFLETLVPRIWLWATKEAKTSIHHPSWLLNSCQRQEHSSCRLDTRKNHSTSPGSKWYNSSCYSMNISGFIRRAITGIFPVPCVWLFKINFVRKENLRFDGNLNIVLFWII